MHPRKQLPSLGLKNSQNHATSKQSDQKSLEFFLKKKKNLAPLNTDRNRIIFKPNDFYGGDSTEQDDIAISQHNSMMIVNREPYNNETASKDFSFNVKESRNLLKNMNRRRNFLAISTDNLAQTPATRGTDAKRNCSPEGAKGRLPPMKQQLVSPPMTARSYATSAYRQFRFSVDLIPTDQPQTARETDGPRIVVDDPIRNSTIESKQIPIQAKRRILAIG